MKTFIKNIKGIALGLSVMGLAIGFSAFTDNEAYVPLQSYYYGWDADANQYRYIGSSYDPLNCSLEGEYCVASSDIDLGPTVEPAEMGFITPVSDEDTHYEFD